MNNSGVVHLAKAKWPYLRQIALCNDNIIQIKIILEPIDLSHLQNINSKIQQKLISIRINKHFQCSV